MRGNPHKNKLTSHNQTEKTYPQPQHHTTINNKSSIKQDEYKHTQRPQKYSNSKHNRNTHKKESSKIQRRDKKVKMQGGRIQDKK